MNTTHIWFDLEGTLLKNPLYDAAVEDFAYQLYLQETGKQRTAETKKEFDALLKQQGRKSLIFVSLGKSKKFYAEAFATQFPFQNYISRDEDVQNVISFLKQKKIGLGVYTSVPRGQLITILGLLGLDPLDFTLLSGDDVQNAKPDPEGFEKIVQCCGVPAEQLIFVGDSEKKDIIPAKSVGMKTILVCGSSLVADYSALDFKELLSFFQKDL
ncbi:HAD family hydrolase [Candidatus Woesearchaeota archaeon]|nr:HAD family hydrolase [Candidatus Woesearchaeota archaeon]